VAVHIYAQKIHRTTQITTNVEECGPCPVFVSFTLAFALQLRKKQGKTSVRLRKTSVMISVMNVPSLNNSPFISQLNNNFEFAIVLEKEGIMCI